MHFLIEQHPTDHKYTLKRLWGYGGTLVRQRHRDGGSFGVVEAVHRVHLQDHAEAVGEDPEHQQGGHQAHPDPRREEPRAVAGVREVGAVGQTEALDLYV